MAANANQPGHDWVIYSFLLAIMGLIIGGVGLIVTVILFEGRATHAEQQTIRAEQKSEAETTRAEQKAEAEEIRRNIAEEIAKANQRAAVNSIRIQNLEETTEPPPASPPPN